MNLPTKENAKRANRMLHVSEYLRFLGDGNYIPKDHSRKFPPYGRELVARLAASASWRQYVGTSADGKSPTIWVLCGPSGWETAQAWRKRRLIVLLPPNGDPYAFDWRALARFAPAVIAPCGYLEQTELHKLADAILRDGSPKVLALTGRDIVRYLRASAKEAA